MSKARVGTKPLFLRAIITLSAAGAPTDVRLLQYGRNDSDYGPIMFDDIAAAMVMQDYREKGITRLYADWNHGMYPLDGSRPTREEAKSCCSFIPEVRNGELWATQIIWTDKGREDVEGGDYNLFSPAFAFAIGDDGELRPRALLNFALVNDAGLNGIQPLIAAGAADVNGNGGDHMDPKDTKITELEARIKAITAENDTLRGSALEVAGITGVLALAANAGADARATAVKGLVDFRTEVMTLTGQDSVAGARGVVQGWKAKADGYDKLATEKAEGETAALDKEINDVIALASKDGKLGFEPAVIEERRAQALAIGGGKPTKEGVAFLQGLAKSMPKAVVTAGAGATPPAAGAGTEGVMTLSAAESEAIKAWGMDPKTAERAKAHIEHQKRVDSGQAQA